MFSFRRAPNSQLESTADRDGKYIDDFVLNAAGPLRSPQEIVAAMSGSEVKSVMKKTGTSLGNMQKRRNIEFNEELSEVCSRLASEIVCFHVPNSCSS